MSFLFSQANPPPLYSLCSTGVDAALALDTKRALRFAALQSPAGKELLRRAGRAEDDISSVVLVTQNEAYTRSDAVIEIAKLLGASPIALALALPSQARDGAYNAVADNRYTLFGRLPQQRWTRGGGAVEEGRFLA